MGSYRRLPEFTRHIEIGQATPRYNGYLVTSNFLRKPGRYDLETWPLGQRPFVLFLSLA